MKLFLQRLISVKPQNENSLFIIYKGRVDAHKSFSSFPMAGKAPETYQCRYFKASLLEGSFAEMCRERGRLSFARSLFESIKDYYGCDG